MLKFGMKKFSRYSSRALSDFDFRLLELQKQTFFIFKIFILLQPVTWAGISCFEFQKAQIISAKRLSLITKA